MDCFTCIDSPLGRLLLASDGTALTGLWMEGQRHYADTLPAGAIRNDDYPVFAQTRQWLSGYFSGHDAGTMPPLAPEGTEFRKAVWRELMKIPHGTTVTYGELSRRVAAATGRKTSARAVGGAVGHNPISIIIPCHRVVAAASPGGYAGGPGRKRFLLNIENSKIFQPLC